MSQLPKYTDGVIDQDRTIALEGKIYGQPHAIPVDDSNAVAVTVTTTGPNAGDPIHDWYRFGQVDIVDDATPPTAAITITVTQASGEAVGLVFVDNQTAFPVTITGAAQDGGVAAPVVPAGARQVVFIGTVSVFDLGAPTRMREYTVATVPAGAAGDGPIFVSDGAAGSPVIAFHDGTSWLRSDTLAAIAAA